MPRFDTITALAIFRAKADFERLNRLDDLWTVYLREAGAVSAEQADALSQMTGEMRDVLGRTGAHVERLQRLIGQQRAAFDEAFRCTLAATQLSPNQRGDVEQVVRAKGGFASFAIEQLTVIRDQSRPEAQVLEGKMASIRERGITEGDLGHRFKCALAVAVLAAGVALMVSTGTILIPSVIAAVNAGGPAWTVVNAFISAHGVNFISEAIIAVSDVAHLVEKCFKHDKS